MKPVANAAGDRRSEAKALFEAQTGERPKDPQLDAVEHDIRRLHGDMDDRA
ncbi:MAG TPA: hypothetical protein VGP92_00605 [Acidimicrobiia bacterium]|nr:hypothetical protein [Acidimicrobiia bacterium]